MLLKLNEKKIMLHPFLFSIFIVIFIYSHNIFVIPIQEIIFPLLSILGITSVSFIMLTRVLKSARKSGLIVSLYLILFFSFGHIFNIVNDFSIGEFDIGRYSYLLILYFRQVNSHE